MGVANAIELFKNLWGNVFQFGSQAKLRELFRNDVNPDVFRFYAIADGQLKSMEVGAAQLLEQKEKKGEGKAATAATEPPLTVYLGQSERRHVYAFRNDDDVQKFNQAKAKELKDDPAQKFQYLALTVDNMETKTYDIPVAKVVSPIWLLLQHLGQGMSSSGVLALLTLLSGLAAGTAVFCLPALLVSLGFLVTGAALLWLYNRYALPPV